MIDLDTKREIEALRERREKLTDTFVRECEKINDEIKRIKMESRFNHEKEVKQ